jgi:hypothetical protein
MTKDIPAVMNDEQAAKYLHIRPSTLRTMVRKDLVPYTRLGERLVVYMREVLDLWLIMGTHGPQALQLKELAIRLRRPYGAPTGVPLSPAEETMLAASRKDLEEGRTFPLTSR